MTRPTQLDELERHAAAELEADATSPDRDLWPAVSRRIALRRRERRVRRLSRAGGAAALLGLLVVAGARMMPSERIPPASSTLAAHPLSSPEVTSLREELGAILADNELPASARSAIADALVTLERERAALDSALTQTPDSFALARLKSEHEAREAALLHRLHRLTRSV